MVEQDLRLLVSVVVSAEDERQAHAACRDLVDRIDGRVVEAGDCSDEEPGCWSVTISKELRSVEVHSDTRGDAAVLARVVRTFVRELAPNSPLPRVCCEPPTAWTVLDDPEVVGKLVAGAERMLVEAWSELAPYPERQPVAEQPEQPVPAAAEEPLTRLALRVEVAAQHPAGAQWQARAVASRIVDSAVITGVVQRADRVSVHLDLGQRPESPDQAVRTASAALGHPDWSPLDWAGGTAVLRWTDLLMPTTGITALELTAHRPDPEPEVVWPTEDEPGPWSEPRS
ncbi:hypothetical protein [Kutzneria albida]|uniref:Uncharacterized protein n=2 Tax=Kutzneria TaxID=43356 RepID=W5VYM3_9PSEU|nr:hypothetical protein [Kutzneria albida]AHH94018.1 hypothetical protein KALB_643 [Kutzneria albida DSM 43870]